MKILSMVGGALRPPQTPQTLPTRGARSPAYLAALTACFTLFSSLRLVSYLPTLWAIRASGDSSQHSLWTWGIWLGSNATLAAWLYESAGRRCNAAIAIVVFNTVMCAVTVGVVWAYRA